MYQEIMREARITAEKMRGNRRVGESTRKNKIEAVGWKIRVFRGVTVMRKKEVSSWHGGTGIGGSERSMGGRMQGHKEHQ